MDAGGVWRVQGLLGPGGLTAQAPTPSASAPPRSIARLLARLAEPPSLPGPGLFLPKNLPIENFPFDRRQVAVGAASRQYSDSVRSLLDKCRSLFRSSQAPDFLVGDLLHVQSWQYHSSFMMNNSMAVEFTAHLPRFGGLPPCRVAPANLQPFSGLFQIPRPFWGSLATGSSSPEPFQKPSLEILKMK